MTYIVISKYVPVVGTSEFAPGEHYSLRNDKPETHIAGQACHRHYRFYRTARGSEVAGDVGFAEHTRNYWEVPRDSPIFRELKETVEAYDREHQ